MDIEMVVMMVIGVVFVVVGIVKPSLTHLNPPQNAKNDKRRQRDYTTCAGDDIQRTLELNSHSTPVCQSFGRSFP